MKIKPDIENQRLTRKIQGLDESLRIKEIDVVEERPLTLFLNSQEIVTMMTINDYPKYLAIGYLLNQNMIKKEDELTGVDFDDDTSTIIVRTKRKTNFESKLKILNIVIGYDKESIKKNLRDFNIQIIENLNYMSGMLSSIKEINNHIDENITGIMISLADMPLVSSEDINSIIDAFLLHNEEKICIPESKGRFGNPMIIPVGIYKKIIQNKNLLKDKGLKSTILDGKFDIIRISTSNGVLKDFDTQEDFN